MRFRLEASQEVGSFKARVYARVESTFLFALDFTPVENNVLETAKLWGKQWYLSMDVKATSAPSGDRGAVVFEDSSGNEWGEFIQKTAQSGNLREGFIK